MNWILTSTGKRFDLFEPDADMIDPRDISHALAHLCRFNGHTREFYSVAQHSCIVAELVPEEHRLAALLHCAPKAYLGYMTRPLNQWMPDYRGFEDVIWMRVCERPRSPCQRAPCRPDCTGDRTPRSHTNRSGYLGLLGWHRTHG